MINQFSENRCRLFSCLVLTISSVSIMTAAKLFDMKYGRLVLPLFITLSSQMHRNNVETATLRRQSMRINGSADKRSGYVQYRNVEERSGPNKDHRQNHRE